jgi:ribose transport system substrate-binding protein
MLTGIGEVMRIPESCRTVSIDGDGQFQTSLERVRKHLRESKAKRVLVGAANDPSALGALRAAQWIVGKPAALYSMEDVLGL